MAENLDQISGLLRNALILVTGAGQGNGRAIAIGVAAAGARVIVTTFGRTPLNPQQTKSRLAAERRPPTDSTSLMRWRAPN
jgi:NAD(P)-dependent dehydrogenase (short-subunit alcohol dehydrogenase family)